MSETEGGLVMVLLFALRCIVPLAITVGLGYLMNRLVDHWQAEDARKEAPVRSNGKVAAPATLAALSLPCWVTFSCSEEARKNCAAYQHPDLPCWEAKRQANNGVLAASCADCPRYQAAFAVAVGD